MINSVSNEDCVGCKACGDICPKGAIEYTVKKDGFWYPVINEDKCVKCDLCDNVCPVMHSDTVRDTRLKNPKVYACKLKNKEIRYNSTSGGLYYALAKTILDQNGYLIGCAYDEKYEGAFHIVANDDEGLGRLIRSKYFQSDTEGIYKITKKLLQEGKTVLFSGAPCQIGALNNYIKGELAEQLYAVDFVCRGINSPLAYKKYMEELVNRYHSELSEVHFKNKSHGWTNLGTLVKFKNGKVYYRNRVNDPWVNGFIVGNLYMRESCHNCRFKKFPRVSDISMGDFWGLKFTDEEEKYGVSLAIVNTEKGRNLFQECRKLLIVEEHSIEEAVEGNGALLKPAPKDEKRERFFERIQNEKFSSVVWSLMGREWPKWWIISKKADVKRLLLKFRKRINGT